MIGEQALFAGFENRQKLRILVVGDVMLDCYLYGTADRVSPEAPVPVLKLERKRYALGGAANVAANVRGIGARVCLIGQVGNDVDGGRVREMLKLAEVGDQVCRSRVCPTTVKTRLISGNKQIARVDLEVGKEDPSVTHRVLAKLCEQINRHDVILISDYGKGFLAPDLLRKIIEHTVALGKVLVVDPKSDDWSQYAGASIIKPNLKEFNAVAGTSITTESGEFVSRIESTARKLIKRYRLGSVLVTLGERGMLYVPVSGDPIRLGTAAHEVCDVSGAGDSVLAAIGVALGCCANVKLAMRIANIAAGVAVSCPGTKIVTWEEIEHFSGYRTKVVQLPELCKVVRRLREDGKSIGFTNGCFDCCHYGHLRSLYRVKALCDILVVAVNSDEWIRSHKGKGRPIQDERTRVGIISALECVDYVIVFNSETPLGIVQAIRPEVLAKEGYHIESWPEARFAQRYGARIEILPREKGYSTTAIVRRCAND